MRERERERPGFDDVRFYDSQSDPDPMYEFYKEELSSSHIIQAAHDSELDLDKGIGIE